MTDEYKSLNRRTFLTIAAAGAGTLALTGSVMEIESIYSISCGIQASVGIADRIRPRYSTS